MSEDSNRSSAIAAAVILLTAGIAFYVMPKIVLFIGGYSPVLAVLVGALFVLGFFLVFWIRSRYQKR